MAKTEHYFIRSSNKKNWWILDPDTKKMNSSIGASAEITANNLGPLRRIYKAAVYIDPNADRLYPLEWPISGAGLKKPTFEEIFNVFGIAPHDAKGPR